MHLQAVAVLCLASLSVSSSIRPKRRIWNQSTLTWRFRDPYGLVKSAQKQRIIRSIISTSFSLWEDAIQGRIQIKEDASNNATDIDIFFARWEHGDKESLDGPGGMVAHSGLPPFGYLHLDADEKWSFDGTDGVDLRAVILHETGHLLGLRHSRNQESIMHPYYRSLEKGMSLSSSSRREIRRLYHISHHVQHNNDLSKLS